MCWKSKLQPLTAGSTHEAELIALSSAGNESVWTRRLLKEIGFAVVSSKPRFVVCQKQKTHDEDGRDAKYFLDNLPPTPVYCDNKGTVSTVNNPISTAQASRHLDVRYFKARDHIRDKKMRVQFISTHLNVADFFTKNLPKEAFHNYRRILMGTYSNMY